MRVLVDDIGHTVTVYEDKLFEGQMVETVKTYVSRQPVVTHDDEHVKIVGHPRTGCVLRVVVDGEEFEGVMQPEYGAQDILAQIGSQITLDDTPRLAHLDTTTEDEYRLHIEGAKIDSIEVIDFEHEELPAHIKDSLTRHMTKY